MAEGTMNKQLIELGIQAGLMTGEKEQLFFCRPIAQFDEYSPELEKFAELIVKKCAKVGSHYGGNVKHLILHYFGVAE
jgi:hypothetical protein